MDLDPLTMTVLLILLIGGLGLVLYLELRYMKKKLRSRIDARIMKDDAYNSLVTTRAVVKILKERGGNVSSAEIFLLKAEGAYERGEYTLCKELVEKAKSSLEEVRLQDRAIEGSVVPAEMEDVERSAEETKKEQAEQKEHEELMTLYEKEKKLPENYLQSKFMIARVRSTIEPLSTTMDVSEARHLLGQAEISFRAGEYTEAFKFACRAKRNLDRVAGSMGKLDGLEIIKIEQDEEETPSSDEICNESPEPLKKKEEAASLICAECGALLSEEDRFCGQCGARVEKKMKCPSCGTMSKEGDRFCRQCGHKLY